MRVRKVDRAVLENDTAAEQVAQLVRRASPARRARAGPTKSGIDRTRTEAEVMRLSNDWSEARPAHVVALYAWCHEQTYGVTPVELVGLNWLAAGTAAGKLARDEFDGRLEGVVEFMRWVWRREAKREKWRRENKHEGGRIGWRAQFVQRYLVTDWRIDAARRK
jgi:hypothetical protein